MNNVLTAFIQPIVEVLPKLPGAIFNVIIGYIFIKIAIFALRRFLRLMKLPKTIKTLVLAIVNVFLWVILVMFVLNYLGLSSIVVALSGSAVLLGFVLNNGLSQSISDIFSGISLASDKDFVIGNRISLNEGKIVGTISSLTTKKVRLVDDDGYVHIVPNSIFDKNEWIVLDEAKSLNKDKRSIPKRQLLKAKSLLRKKELNFSQNIKNKDESYKPKK